MLTICLERMEFQKYYLRRIDKLRTQQWRTKSSR